MMKKWQPSPMRREGESTGGPVRRPPVPASPAPLPMPTPKPAPPAVSDPPTPTRRTSSFGPVPWGETGILAGMDEFLSLLAARPAVDRDGSMASVGLFAFWHVLRAIKPAIVVECGVHRGLTTWLIEKAVPEAQLVCIDRDLGRLAYRSDRAEYVESGFLDLALDPEGAVALAIFDDHGDALPRVRRCAQAGIMHLLFDDNYPEQVGNRHRSLAASLAGADGEGDEVRRLTETYFVFPPVFDHPEPVTLERSLILEPSLLGTFDPTRDAERRIFEQDMSGYRWPTYLKLR